MKTEPPIAETFLSVIIVTYNSAKDIGGCLASIPRTLAGGAVEGIVVDNASNDTTTRDIKTNYPWVTLIEAGGNLGFSKANNLGFDRSSGAFILFLNPDTAINSETLESCLARLTSQPQIGIISPRLLLADGSLDLACRRAIPTAWDGFTRASGLAKKFPRSRLFAGYNLTWMPEEGTYPVGSVNGAFMLTSRRVLSRIGLFDERFFMYAEDLDLCLRCSQAGYQVIYDGSHSILHLKGQSSRQNSQMLADCVFTSTRDLYLKHFNIQNSLLTRAKYTFLFWLWSRVNRLRKKRAHHTEARPL